MILAIKGRNNALRAKATSLLTMMKEAQERLKNAYNFYTEIPLWSHEPPEKLPLHEWFYVLDGKVGIYFLGNTVYSTVCLLRADGDLPENSDASRSRTVQVCQGYVVDKSTGRKYFYGESFGARPNETLSLSVHGLVKIFWVPSLPIQSSLK